MLAADPATRPASVPAFVRDLASHGERIALRLDEGTTETYSELARRVDAIAAGLGSGGARRLVLLTGSNTAGSIAAYLGALAAGHVVLLAPSNQEAAVDALVEAYDPDVLIGRPADRDLDAVIAERRPGTRHDLHPDLALLLSTSGSTGSPKLVRLSAANLDANAAAIVAALCIQPDHRAATTLPMHYTYGLSVIHTHLLVGASLIVTDSSVIDRCFWDRFRADGGTTLAGVPYTFECLDRVGFADLDLPNLRSVTQAGGRLDPERVRGYAELGRRRGWTFSVMYGQTEATARMAVLPSDLAVYHPSTIGRPIPGGVLRIEPVTGAPDGVGELVYRGPNVMLGYAESPADLALGRTVDELRTGDLGRALPGGLFELTGRLSAFVKIAGVRIDLEHVERRLEGQGYPAACAGTDGELSVAVEGDANAADLRAVVAEVAALPDRLVRVVAVEAIPRLPTGKVDRGAIRELAATDGRGGRASSPPPPLGDADDPRAAIRRLYAASIGREVGDSDSFVGLGGDSLSYVDTSLGLEEVLGRLPAAWPTMSVAELAATGSVRRSRAWWNKAIGFRWVETSIVLRALAILCIVSQHAGWLQILGGAHVLVGVAGFNFARFQLTPARRLDRLRSQARAIARIALPTMAWIALMLVVTDDYQLQNLVLANAIVGPDRFDATWHFWFVEMLVYVLIVMSALLAIPLVHRIERRWPFALASAIVAIGLAFRFGILEHNLTNPRPVLWLFAIGLAAGKATTWWQRAGLALIAIWAVPGFYGNPQRDAAIAGGLVALIILRRVPIPRLASPVVGILASASLAIYLVQWQVYPALPDVPRELVFLASVGAGLAVWLLARWLWAGLGQGRTAYQAVRRRVRGDALAPSG